MKLAPVVLFVYNRPFHTRQTVEVLQKNELAKESELFIYSDAPKNEKAKESVAKVREYIKSINGFKKVTIIEREKNWGLADSIIDGVTKIVNEYGKVIVLEDDLVTSPYFLRFMNDALEFYKDEKKVWHISGYTPPLNTTIIKEHFFIKPTTCWGWATWSDRWMYFKKDATYFINKFNKTAIKDFNINNTYNYYSHLLLNYKNKIDTWAIFWYATSYFNDALSLHPRRSFVQNIGHDGSGTHCANSCDFEVEILDNYEHDFPREVSMKKDYSLELEKYFISLKKPMLYRIMKKLKRVVKGSV